MMSGVSKGKMKVAVELVRKGATVLAGPCPQCGGIQVRYQGKIHCTAHEDLSSVVKSEGASYEDVVARMRATLVTKLNESAHLLEDEKDAAKQELLVTLITKCFDLLQELSEKRRSP